MLFFFFFKQKTAYEMRISDWSSDVCSSDLRESDGRRREFSSDRRDLLGKLRGKVGRSPPVEIDLRPDLQVQQGKEMVGVVLAAREMEGHGLLDRRPGEQAAPLDRLLGQQAEQHGLQVALQPGADRRAEAALPALEDLRRQNAVERPRSEEHTSELQPLLR